MKAKPLIDATSSIPSKLNYLGSIAPESKAEIFIGNEIISTIVEMMRDPIAYGAALKTKSRFFSNVKPAKPSIRISLNNFSDKNKSPEIRFKVPKIYTKTSNRISEAKRKNNAETNVIRMPERRAAALK